MPLKRRAVALWLGLVVASPALVIASGNDPAHAAGYVAARTTATMQRWSDPATWGGRRPAQGDIVRIPSGAHVRLDVSTPNLGGLYVDGTLSFKEKDLELTSAWIMVHGRLRIGRATDPFVHRAVITLTGADRTDDVMGMGTKVLGVMGGTIDLHGRSVVPWTRLGATAQPGATKLTLERDVAWRPGDKLVISSSDYWSRHDEERTVTWASGRTVELDRPLDYQHWGELQTFGGRTLDERAEVGLLSRNIVVRGNAASSVDGFGGHMMVMEGSVVRVQGAEFTNMGQKKALRRYPIHFHMDGNAPQSYVRRSSIHHTYNRCLVVHGTNELSIRGNVCFDHLGHGFFLEDGAERRNVIVNNLGLGTHEIEDGLLSTDERPATFWITNPDNVLRGNVAAGSDGIGVWYALPEHPTGLSGRDDLWPRRTPLREFSGKVAHSNADSGLFVDHGLGTDGDVEATSYTPVEDPQDPDSAPVVARFDSLTSYMNRIHGVWLRGDNHVVTGSTLADNRSGATFASTETFLEDSLVVGESANMGTTEPWEDPGPTGRALPTFWNPDNPIIGFEFYDGRVGVRDTTFAGFNDNVLRRAAGLGYLSPDAFGIDPKNFSENVRFIDAQRVYLEDPVAGYDGDASKVFVDRDGSLTGAAGNVVVADNHFLLGEGCEFRSGWNAFVCPPADYATLVVGTLDGNPQAIKPLTLRRPNGTTQTLMGCCSGSDEAYTTVLADRSYEVAFNGGTPARFRFVLYRGRGHAVELSVPVAPGFKVTRWGSALPSVASRSALSQSAQSAWFYDAQSGVLHVKVSGARSDWEEVRVVPQ